MKINKEEMDLLLRKTSLSFNSIARISNVTEYELRQYLYNDRKLKPSESLRIDICIKALRQSVATVPNKADMHKFYIRKAGKGKIERSLSISSCNSMYETNLREIVEREIYRREQKAINAIMQVAECHGE